MRLIWTQPGAVSDVRRTLRAHRHDTPQCQLNEIEDPGRITRKYPVLIDANGVFVEEIFSFLFDIGYVRGTTQSARTLQTYGESLLAWLSYAEARGLEWRRPTAIMLAQYRDHLLGTQAFDRPLRVLARRTVNLRLTVAIGFYKHLGWISGSGSLTLASSRHLNHVARKRPLLVVRSASGFEGLRVRTYSRRPMALRAEQCRALCFELHNPYRLMWQWALCTGLRTVSLVQIDLKAFESMVECASDPQTLDVVAKGGKVVTVSVPTGLRNLTELYIAIDRVMAAAAAETPLPQSTLFLNSDGRPVTSKGYYRALKRAGRRLKIRVRPHQARTTFATYVRDKLEALNRRGQQIDAVKVVQCLLAHSDARTTEEYLESIDVPSLDVLAILDELCAETTTDVAS